MEKMLHIGIDARLWQETGVGRYIRNLVLQLQEKDTKNTYTLFILPQDRKSIEQVVTNAHWHLVDVPIHWHTLKEQLLFPKIIATSHVDLMHFPYFSVPIFYPKPFVATIHDVIPFRFPTGKASTLPKPFYYIKYLGYQFVLRFVLQKARKIIVPSQATKKELVTAFHTSQEKIVVTLEGYDPLIVSPLKTVPVQEPYFLYVGNAYPHKNLPRLLKAFQLFQVTTTDSIKLVLVGKEDYFYNRLQSLVRQLCLSDWVIRAGYVSDEALAAYYDNAIALVAPSLMEGFGLPALEAMSRGTVIASSDIPAFREVCDDVPYYFDPVDTESIANCLEKVWKGHNNNANKKKKGQLLAKRFSWEKMAEETKAIYESCARL